MEIAYIAKTKVGYIVYRDKKVVTRPYHYLKSAEKFCGDQGWAYRILRGHKPAKRNAPGQMIGNKVIRRGQWGRI